MERSNVNTKNTAPRRGARGRGPLVLFDMDGTLLKPDSWRENGVGFLYPGMADVLAPFISRHRCGLLTGCEAYRIKGALLATDPRLERWIEKGHFFCEMGLVQLEDGVKRRCGSPAEREMMEELREEMGEHYALFPGSEVMVTLTPRYELGETIVGLKQHFLENFPEWAERLTVTTSSEAVDFMPKGFTKANGIEMALEAGYHPIHFVADSWGDMEALEMIRDRGLGLAALVGQAGGDVKDRWLKGCEGRPDTRHHALLVGSEVDAIVEFISLLDERFPPEH